MKRSTHIALAGGATVVVMAGGAMVLGFGSDSTSGGATVVPSAFEEVTGSGDVFEKMRAGDQASTDVPPAGLDLAAPAMAAGALLSQTPAPAEPSTVATAVASVPPAPTATPIATETTTGECSTLDESAGRCTRAAASSVESGASAPVASMEPTTAESSTPPSGTGLTKDQFVNLVADRGSMPPPPAESAPNAGRRLDVTEAADPLKLLSDMTEIRVTKGRKVSASGRYIRNGCRILALVDDSFSVVSGDKSPTTLTPFGPLDGCGESFPSGLKLIAEAQGNKNETRLSITVTGCSDQQAASSTFACKAVAKDLLKGDGLAADVYSKAGWSIVTGFATTFLAGLALERLTMSATDKGTVVDQSQANQTLQAFSKAIISAGDELRKSFDKSGTVLEVERRSFVQVLFTEDAGPF